MKIELWSDYACPFCYIGEKRLEKALRGMESAAADEARAGLYREILAQMREMGEIT